MQVWQHSVKVSAQKEITSQTNHFFQCVFDLWVLSCLQIFARQQYLKLSLFFLYAISEAALFCQISVSQRNLIAQCKGVQFMCETRVSPLCQIFASQLSLIAQCNGNSVQCLCYTISLSSFWYYYQPIKFNFIAHCHCISCFKSICDTMSLSFFQIFASQPHFSTM